MSHKQTLVGIINTDNSELPEIQVNKIALDEPAKLRELYGWIGKGLEIIIGKPRINASLERSPGLVLSSGGIGGLENIAQREAKIIKHILSGQYRRSDQAYLLARNEEMTDYDNVTVGALKGIVLGAMAGGILDLTKFKGVIPELLARAGPAIMESAGIRHEVIDKKGRGAFNPVRIAKELPSDVIAIAKRVPHAIYDATNMYGWIDRLRGLEEKSIAETTTQVWAEAQEPAPVRGLFALGVLKYLDNTFGISKHPTIKPLYAAAESLAVFWVNTGNNVEGCMAVYREFKDSEKSFLSRHLEATKKFLHDPFQLANVFVCSGWYSAELYLRSHGMAPEEQFGMLGAGLESALLSCDTAVAGQVAKGIAYGKIVIPARLSVANINLYRLDRKFTTEL